jgi:hypothetical protein
VSSLAKWGRRTYRSFTAIHRLLKRGGEQVELRVRRLARVQSLPPEIGWPWASVAFVAQRNGFRN